MQKDKTKKASIIVPCFNVEKYLPIFLMSLYEQTYQNIELILINDGSTDKTDKVINQNISMLRKKMEVQYIIQNNRGLGGAINTGLKKFTGDYLCWADPDDYLEPRSIEERVCYLEKNPDVGVVTTDAEIREGSVDGNIRGYISDLFLHDNENPEQFMLLLKAKSILCAGCHMIRTDAFLDVNPNRDIYEAKRGQNWQILLPVYYKYKRGFLDKPLYRYVIYPSSMSQGDDTVNKKILREIEHEEIVFNTLERMNMTKKERKYYKKIFANLIKDNLFNIVVQNEMFVETLKCFIKLLGTEYMNKDKIVDLIVLIRKKLQK